METDRTAISLSPEGVQHAYTQDTSRRSSKEEINRAIADAKHGNTIKPVLRISRV